MEALNIWAEYRKLPLHVALPSEQTVLEYANSQVNSGQWVKDDGDYYPAEEWEEQYAEEHAYDGPIPGPEDEEWDDVCHCGHPECGAC